MDEVWLASYALAWVLLLCLGFLVLGLLRQLGLADWRIRQLEATTPRRIGRDGLAPGATAPGFSLQGVDGHELSLGSLAGRPVLLAFTEPGCGPCDRLVPALNQLNRKRDAEVVAISGGDQETARTWARQRGVEFPVLVQEGSRVSRRYEVFATPFGFLIDRDGVIAARGILNGDDDVGFLLSTASKRQPAKGNTPAPAWRRDEQHVLEEGERS